MKRQSEDGYMFVNAEYSLHFHVLLKIKLLWLLHIGCVTVAGADKIVVLSDGKVAETGTPDELMKKDGIFVHMSKLQTQGQNWNLEN